MQQEHSESFFPELEADEQRSADDWLKNYLRLVIRIYREHLAQRDNPQASP